MGGDAASKRRSEYSENDVLEVLRLMKAAYNVDESRIYLIGHSMGAIGTWALRREVSANLGGARLVFRNGFTRRSPRA
jgi:predicted peptidase